MLSKMMTKSFIRTNTRRWFMQSCAAVLLAGVLPNKSFAAGYLRGSGEIRKVRLQRPEAGEKLDMIYWVEGKYIREALSEFNYFCRDLVANTVHVMDTRLIDILAASQILLDTNEPFSIQRGFVYDYRLMRDGLRPEKKPNPFYHSNGTALDVSLTNQSIKQISRAAIRCRSGGVGRYPQHNYVHIDCNEVRDWDE
jgi:uncharacterized protein YcbK (DUF882 family)